MENRCLEKKTRHGQVLPVFFLRAVVSEILVEGIKTKYDCLGFCLIEPAYLLS